MLYYKENPNPDKNVSFADVFVQKEEDTHIEYPKLCSDVDVLAVVLANSTDTNSAVHFLTEFNQESFTGKEENLPVVEPSLEHFQKAKEIRQYYCDKLVMLKLKSNKTTKFREHLYIMLTKNINEIDQDHIKILCKIQEFYNYDMILEEISNNAAPVNAPARHGKQVGWFDGEVKLNLVKKAYRNTKRIKQWEYWLRDDQTNETFRIMFNLKNELLPLFDHYIQQRNNTITITGYFNMATLNGFPNFNFYNVNKWDFVLEK